MVNQLTEFGSPFPRHLGSRLRQLKDVSRKTPVVGDVLMYTASGKWEATTPASPLTLDDTEQRLQSLEERVALLER